jgi:cyclopropane-fatty-acyl-phospholipid synthase
VVTLRHGETEVFNRTVETVTYSCGIFERPDSTLEKAAVTNYGRICRKLELGPEDDVLEIGNRRREFCTRAAIQFCQAESASAPKPTFASGFDPRRSWS